MSREDQILTEIDQHRQALEGFQESGDFAQEIVRMQLVDRIEELELDLRDVRGYRLDVIFKGEPVIQQEMPAALLSKLLGRLQRTLTWTSYALKFGPGVENDPPASIWTSTTANVLAMAPGSFCIALRRPEPDDALQERLLVEDAPLYEKSIQLLLDLAEAAAEEALTEQVEELARSIGRKPTQQIQRLMRNLADSGLDTRFVWDTAEPREVEISAHSAASLSNWLSSVEQATSEIRVSGMLIEGNGESGRFIFRDVAGNDYPGRADPETLSGKEINGQYIARISILESVADHIGTTAYKYTLLGLSNDPLA